jgi:dTDP-4-dehydrorhamnose 3,5-epimerase
LIDGVKIIEITTHKDERGFFREIFQFPEQFNGLSVGQLSHSLVNKSVVKAWHGHLYQSQWNYVVSGQIKVALLDNRKESIAYEEIYEFVTGDESKPMAYFFPPGILHGYKCLKGPMQIIYVTSGVYDLEDEIRIPFDDPEIEFKW